MRRSSTSSSEPEPPTPDRTRAGLAALACLAGLAATSLIPLEPLTENIAEARVAYRFEVYELDPRWVADAGPRSRHASNGQGLRGDVIVGRGHEVLLVGGSTTECSLLDEPAALPRQIADRHGDPEIRVAALAQGGLPLSELVVELEAFTADHRRPRVVVGMFGANEAQAFFNHAPWSRSTADGPWEVWIEPQSAFGVEGRASIYRGWYRPGSHGRFLAAPRAAYDGARSQWRSTLHPAHIPFLRDALRAYVASLVELERVVRARDAGLVLVTQAIAPWSPPGQGRGWAPFIYSGIGEGFLPSPELSAELLEAFNEQTRQFARERGIPLVDLARDMDGCAACFYDQWHFTNTGAARAAELIVPALERGP